MFTSKNLLTLVTLSGSASTGIAMAAFNHDNKSSGGEIGWSVFWGCIGGALATDLVPAYGIAFPLVASCLYFNKKEFKSNSEYNSNLNVDK